MIYDADSIGSEAISFLNRDHIVSVTIRQGEIVVTTTAGTTIIVPASKDIVSKFADDLASAAQSNFVSVAGPRADNPEIAGV